MEKTSVPVDSKLSDDTYEYELIRGIAKWEFGGHDHELLLVNLNGSNVGSVLHICRAPYMMHVDAGRVSSEVVEPAEALNMAIKQGGIDGEWQYQSGEDGYPYLMTSKPLVVSDNGALHLAMAEFYEGWCWVLLEKADGAYEDEPEPQFYSLEEGCEIAIELGFFETQVAGKENGDAR